MFRYNVSDFIMGRTLLVKTCIGSSIHGCNDFGIAHNLPEDEIDNWFDSRKRGICLRRLELALVKKKKKRSRTRRYRYSDGQIISSRLVRVK